MWEPNLSIFVEVKTGLGCDNKHISAVGSVCFPRDIESGPLLYTTFLKYNIYLFQLQK